MAKTMTLAAGGTVTQNISLTRYVALGGMMSVAATEAPQQITMRTAGVFSRMTYQLQANGVTATSTLTFRINAGAGTLVISIGSGATGQFEDATHSDAVVAGDKVAFQFVTGGTGTNLVHRVFGVVFNSQTRTLKRLVYRNDNSNALTTSTTYIPISGGPNGVGTTTTESDCQFPIQTDAVIQNGFANITTNTNTTAITLTSRINTANGTITMSITNATTGIFEDTTHTDTINKGDLVNWSVVASSNTGAWVIGIVSLEMDTRNGQFIYLAANEVSGTLATSLTRFNPLEGGMNPNAAENVKQATAELACTLSNLSINLKTNGISATSTCNFRKNTANGNQSVSITASTTGRFSDTTNTDDIVSTDLIATQLITGGTGTTMIPMWAGCLGTVKQSAGFAPFF